MQCVVVGDREGRLHLLLIDGVFGTSTATGARKVLLLFAPSYCPHFTVTPYFDPHTCNNRHRRPQGAPRIRSLI